MSSDIFIDTTYSSIKLKPKYYYRYVEIRSPSYIFPLLHTVDKIIEKFGDRFYHKEHINFDSIFKILSKICNHTPLQYPFTDLMFERFDDYILSLPLDELKHLVKFFSCYTVIKSCSVKCLDINDHFLIVFLNNRLVGSTELIQAEKLKDSPTGISHQLSVDEFVYDTPITILEDVFGDCVNVQDSQLTFTPVSEDSAPIDIIVCGVDERAVVHTPVQSAIINRNSFMYQSIKSFEFPDTYNVLRNLHSIFMEYDTLGMSDYEMERLTKYIWYLEGFYQCNPPVVDHSITMRVRKGRLKLSNLRSGCSITHKAPHGYV